MSEHDLQAVVRQAFDSVAQHGVAGSPRGALAYAYMRVSTSGQADELRSGLPRQMAHIHEKARELHLTIPFEDDIDVVVWQSICEVITDPEILITALEDDTPADEELKNQLAYVERQISQLEREADKWDRAYTADVLSMEEYKEKRAAVRTRRQNLDEQRTEVKSRLADMHEVERRREIIREQLAYMRESGLAADLPFGEKRRIMAMLIDQVVVDTVEKTYRLEGVIEGTYSFGAEEAQGEYLSAVKNTSSERWRWRPPARTTVS